MRVFILLVFISTLHFSCTKNNTVNDADRKYCWTCIDNLGNHLFDKCDQTLEQIKNTSGSVNGYPPPIPDSVIYKFCTKR